MGAVVIAGLTVGTDAPDRMEPYLVRSQTQEPPRGIPAAIEDALSIGRIALCCSVLWVFTEQASVDRKDEIQTPRTELKLCILHSRWENYSQGYNLA